ncbi:CopG family transcriptional regulator [Microbacterium sp. KUDC0406]|uniref:CopG family transcriptional regulator n=1 Tax=Microbacterium sp. KUDC0406 TaxID=2909588 RepID=UPI001F160C64|nr:CopG family transcriptional regulator [Microbacterium sp. KUDC0406]UJP10063.1 CopG family transcriptional regulator [Microbacterium sp. KUDC0406]
MKTAISVPDPDFERFERVAEQHGMNRSEFYRRAGERFADALEGGSELTRIADSVLARAAHSDEDLFVRENERIQREGADW